MWRKRASAADVLEIEELRRRVMGAEAEVAKVKVEVGVARERYTEAVQRSQEAGARVAGLCQELGTWQERWVQDPCMPNRAHRSSPSTPSYWRVYLRWCTLKSRFAYTSCV
jgi:hypothetical protein